VWKKSNQLYKSTYRRSPLTYAEIGERYKRSPEWVEETEARALNKLKGRVQLRNLLLTRDLGADGYEDE